jgi:CMP-N,N'-diacetyllegionaminic acid synthase
MANNKSDQPRVLCIIPARGGSKGLSKKNIRLLRGRPLIAWPVRAAQLSGAVDDVLVSTDTEDIAAEAREAGADVPFLRPAELAQDLTTTEASLQQALSAYEEHKGISYDICVFLTATDIFRHPKWITEAVDVLRENPDIESAFSVHATTKNYWHQNAEGEWKRILPWMQEYSSRQIRQKIFREDTGMACASRAQLWRAGRRIGDKVHLIENSVFETGIDIHSEFDLYLAEKAIEYFLEHEPERAAVFVTE